MANRATRVRGFGKTSVGRHRKNNEDAFVVKNDMQVFAVSDGMGGGAAGEVASSTAVESIDRIFQAHGELLEASSADDADLGELVKLTVDAIQDASEAVYNLAQHYAECGRAGCTLTAIIVVGRRAIVAHVGDSRIYLKRGQRVHQLSTDHTVAAAMVQQGILKPDQIRAKPFSSNLTRAVGIQRAVQVDTLTMPVLPGDRFMLCSDGLSDYIGDEAWLAKMIGAGEPEAALDGLIQHANDSGGRDNVTAIVVSIEADISPEQASLLTDSYDLRVQAMGANFLFRDLSLVDLTPFLEASTEIELDAGETALALGDPCASVYIVLSGRCALKWYDRVLAELGHGEFAGASALARPRVARASLVAVEPTRILTLERDAFRQVLWAHQQLGVTLFERLAWRIAEEFDLLVEWRRPRDGFFDRF